MGTVIQCVYCGGQTSDRPRDGDHVIPAAMGRFAGELLLKSICAACNKLAAVGEEQLLRCAPEAFARRLVNPPVQRAARGQSWVGAGGKPPPSFTIDHGDHEEIVDASTEDASVVRPIAQFVVIDSLGTQHHIKLFPSMTPQAIARILEARRITSIRKVYLHAYQSEWDAYTRLAKALWPDSEIHERPSLAPGSHLKDGRATFEFDRSYWRAIAKIGFHYYLTQTRRGLRGNEPRFASIRAFILNGGDESEFIDVPGPRFFTGFGRQPDGSVRLPNSWCHILAAADYDGIPTAMVCLFLGPMRLAPMVSVRLSNQAHAIVLPGGQYCHSYRYDVAKGATYAGTVVKETLWAIA